MSDIFQKAIATALGVEGEELLTSLTNQEGEFKEDAQQLLSNRLASHINGLRDEDKQKFEDKLKNMVSKTKKETAESFEKKLKELVGEESDLQGAEAYVEAIKTQMQTIKKSKPEGYNFKADPEFIAYEQKLREAEKAKADELVAEWQGKYNNLATEVENGKINGKLEAKAREFWATRKPAIQDPTILENQFQEFKRRVLSSANMKVIEGNLVLLNGEGELLKNEFGHPVDLDQVFTNQFVGYIPETVQTPRSSSGLTPEESAKVTMPKTMEELDKIVNDMSIPLETRNKIMQLWEQKNSQ